MERGRDDGIARRRLGVRQVVHIIAQPQRVVVEQVIAQPHVEPARVAQALTESAAQVRRAQVGKSTGDE
jgi:hypothetical protein